MRSLAGTSATGRKSHREMTGMARVSLCPLEANAGKGGIIVYSVIQDLAQSSAQASGSGPAWEMAGVIAAAGAFGGLVNALLNSGNGFSIQLPRRGTNDVLQLGTVGNLVLGIAAALISWGLYGPLRDAALVQAGPAGQPAGSQALTATSTATLTITAVIGAILAGAGGARVISNELDKKLLRDAGAGAAQQARQSAAGGRHRDACPGQGTQGGQEHGRLTDIPGRAQRCGFPAARRGQRDWLARAVPIALEDPDVTPARAFELTMRFAAGQLGFEWRPPGRARSRGSRERCSSAGARRG